MIRIRYWTATPPALVFARMSRVSWLKPTLGALRFLCSTCFPKQLRAASYLEITWAGRGWKLCHNMPQPWLFLKTSICIYILIYIYIYIYINVYICIYIYIYVYMYMYLYIYICLCIFIYIYMCVYVYIYICICIRICICICLYVWMHACMYTYTYM